MIVLKIIGIVLLVIIGLIGFILLLRIRINLDFKKGDGFLFSIGILFFTFGNKKPKKEKVQQEKPKEEQKQESAPKKEKKPNKLVEKIKKKLGLDIDLKHDVEKEGVSGIVSKILTLLILLGNRIKWLLKKFRLDRLDILVICGGTDAADTAMDYGLVCSTVYPFVGYLTANLNSKKNPENVQLGCDFDGESDFDIGLTLSVRIFNIIKALMLGLIDLSQNAAIQEEKYEQRQ